METPTAIKKYEAVACAVASLVLGGFLASSAENLIMQVMMMSLPPAALLVALRRQNSTSPEADNHDDTPITVQPLPDSTTFEEVTAGLEFDILTRAS